MEKKPKIAILRWEEGLVPEGLMQLEALPGNSTNPASYPFEVKMVHVPGACTETVITHPSQKLLAEMIDMSKKMIEEDGVEAISTSCGFNAIFQKEMAEALTVPVFSSSLLQVPYVQALIGKNRTVGVITANKASLTQVHLQACGITEEMNVKVMGLEDCPEWSKIFDEPDRRFDMDTVTEEILGVARKGKESCPQMGAIVLECTDLPPYAARIRQELGLPVFDFSSMMGHMALALGVIGLY